MPPAPAACSTSPPCIRTSAAWTPACAGTRPGRRGRPSTPSAASRRSTPSWKPPATGSLPLWLTEFGWSTNTGAYGVTEAKQAEYLEAAFAKLAEWPYVEVAFWYTFRNVFFRGEDPADWEANTGVLRVDFSPKPAFAALRAAARPSAPPVPASATAAPVAPAGAGVRRRRSTTVVRLSRAGSRRLGVHGRVRGASGGLVRLVVLDARRGAAGRRAAAPRAVRLDRAGRFRSRLRLGRPVRVRVEARYLGSPEAAPSVGRSRVARLGRR